MISVKEFLDGWDCAPKALEDRILHLSSAPDGMTIGVLLNRLRKFDRDEVARAVDRLQADGRLQVRALSPSPGKNGKSTLVLKSGQ